MIQRLNQFVGNLSCKCLLGVSNYVYMYFNMMKVFIDYRHNKCVKHIQKLLSYTHTHMYPSDLREKGKTNSSEMSFISIGWHVTNLKQSIYHNNVNAEYV